MQNELTTRVFPEAGTPTAARRDAMMAAVMASCVGAMLVLGVGFLHAQPVHDAAHDTRHAIGFPCH